MDDSLVVETADVKPCPHGFVFIDKCSLCSMWISVKDRLPDKTKGVLVWAHGYASDYIEIAIYANGNFTIDNVTHWMPLPLPPRPE